MERPGSTPGGVRPAEEGRASKPSRRAAAEPASGPFRVRSSSASLFPAVSPCSPSPSALSSLRRYSVMRRCSSSVFFRRSLNQLTMGYEKTAAPAMPAIVTIEKVVIGTEENELTGAEAR